jgi:uncharacterized membrane protein
MDAVSTWRRSILCDSCADFSLFLKLNVFRYQEAKSLLMMATLTALYFVSTVGALALTWAEGAAAGGKYDFWRFMGLFLCLVWPLIFLLLALFIVWRRWRGPGEPRRADHAFERETFYSRSFSSTIANSLERVNRYHSPK